MYRLLFILLYASTPILAVEPTPAERKAAEDNLREAKKATEQAASGLKWLSRALWLAGYKSDSNTLKDVKSKFDRTLAKPAKDLDKALGELQRVTGSKNDKEPPKNLVDTIKDSLKLLKPGGQADELERLAPKVRELPIGLVSETVDDEYKVSADLLISKPKESEARFKKYLSAMRENSDRLTNLATQLEDTAEVSSLANKLFIGLADKISKVAPHTGAFGKGLMEQYLDVDRLAKAYASLAADCTAKAKEAKRAANLEKQRHEQLKTSIKTYFNFNG